MKNLKRLALAFVLIAGVGFGMASCSDDYYYEEPDKIVPLPPSSELPVAPTPDPANN